ncbi:MAG TPA: Lrp/AsnC family transcriptional regulator [Candidatus Rifleibacterium sp.]|nr:Lrp/AsnC family transcriptional regulator [Candidatus Rifleibacterium sp.]HPT47588.1 Lrp/AsnC family transcriptional regulator [Candidatus Rifleibacterium sp.]
MDDKDREILQMLQGRFPLESEPYKVIGDKLWMDEVSVISRIARMYEAGVIRYIGPFFDSRKLGYSGCLAAMQAPIDQLDRIAGVINQFSEVTHNYLRDGSPNLWFTVIAPSAARRDEIIASIKQQAGVEDVLVFTSRKLYKVKVDLD